MLKRKLYKAGFFFQIFIVVVIRSKAGVNSTDPGGNPFTLHPGKISPANESDSSFLKAGIKTLLYAPAIPLHPSMEKFIADYADKNDDLFEKLRLKNSSSLKTIDKIFSKQGLPVELKYLAVVESKLKTTAVSKVGAMGMWQLMPATAKKLGLKVSGKIDERKYAWKSSAAAARYLQELYEIFDDWLLVIAAYNSGPAPVLNAIKKSGSRNFWQLQYFLPKETRLHVKRFIATHYYFEGEGSLVTLTKKETEIYLASVEDFLAKQNNDKSPEDSPYTAYNYFNWVAIVNDLEKLNFIARK